MIYAKMKKRDSVLLVKQASTILIAPQGVVCDGGMLFLRVGNEPRGLLPYMTAG